MDPEIEQPALEDADAPLPDGDEEAAPPAVAAPDEADLKRQARSEIEQAFAEKARRALSGDREALASLSSWERRALGPALEKVQAAEQSEEERQFEYTLNLHDKIQAEMAGYARESDYLNTLPPDQRQWFLQFRAGKAQLGLPDDASSADIKRALDAQTARERAVALQDVTKNTDPWDEYDALMESDDARLLTDDQRAKLSPQSYLHEGTNLRAIKAMVKDFYAQVAEAKAQRLAAPVAAEAERVNGRATSMQRMAGAAAPVVPAGRGAPRTLDVHEAGRLYADNPTPENARQYQAAREAAGWR